MFLSKLPGVQQKKQDVGLVEKADSVIAVKRNAEFNAAVNATTIRYNPSGCHCNLYSSTSKRRSTHLLFQHKPHSQQLLAKQP